MMIHFNTPGADSGKTVAAYDKSDRSSKPAGSGQSEKVNTGYALDISGKVRDNDRYNVHGRTMEEVMQNA